MWIYKDKEVTSEDVQEYAAFVYLITNLVSGKKYIGKKALTFTRTKKVKGKSRRTKVVKESDWKNYYGSNKALHADIEKYGKDKFRREILHFCKTRGSSSYMELKEQIIQGALESDQFYNDQLYCRIHRSHLKF